MRILHTERTTLEAFFPGLDDALARLTLQQTERPGNPSLALFREHGGPGLMVPAPLGGAGATMLDAVRIQRALGSRAPSLAVAATMHHFSTAALVGLARLDSPSGTETSLLGQIADRRMYLASGFAEGRPGAGIVSSAMRVERCPEGLRVNGSKKPCSLSASMDLLTASLIVPGANGSGDQLAVAIIPADAPGIQRRPFWTSPILAGAESDEVALVDLVVPEAQLVYLGPPDRIDPVQLDGFVGFELLIAAAYLGIATALVERVYADGRADPSGRAPLAAELEGAMLGLEAVAREAAGPADDRLLARALCARHAVSRATRRTTDLAAELLGGLRFIGSHDVAYLLAASRALAFHPPSLRSATEMLDAYFGGGRMSLS